MEEGEGKCVQHETRLLFFCSSSSTHLLSALKSFIQTKLVSATALYLVCLSLSLNLPKRLPLFTLSRSTLFPPQRMRPFQREIAFRGRRCTHPILSNAVGGRAAVSPFAQEEIRATHAVRRPTDKHEADTAHETRKG